MVRIVIRGYEGPDIEVLTSPDSEFTYDNHYLKDELEYQGSKQKWINVVLDEIPTKGYSSLRIEAKFVGNNSVCNKLSKVGIWTAVRDKEMDDSIGDSQYVHCSKKFAIPIKEWHFGTTARAEMTLMDGFSYTDQFNFSLCFRPVFHMMDREFSRNHNTVDIIKAELSITGIRQGATDFIEIPNSKKTISFRLTKDEDKTTTTRTLLKLFDEYDAFSGKGDGYSIHPKQIITILGIEQYLKNVKDKIDMAYIGTDTTENLRSVTRYLREHPELIKKINSLTVYYNKDWDEELMDYFKNSFQISLIGDGFNKFHLVEMTEDPNPLVKEYRFRENINNEIQPHKYKLAPVDLVIATYVTPWAVGSNTKQEYVDLCKKLLAKESSSLISIDPGSSEYLVRSIVKTSFNLNDWYIDNLKLKPKKITKSNNGKHGIIDCKQWDSGGF